MAVVRPFYCIRPRSEFVHRVAALPYDVFSRAEALAEAKKDLLSFLNIDRPETQFDEGQDMYADEVYEKAREILDERIADGTFLTERERCYFVYELVMDGRSQTGIVACASVDDYLGGVIKKHENTREDKELDRIRHVDACNAQTGPIFLAYRGKPELTALVRQVKQEEKLYGFTARDGVTHNVWRIADADRIRTVLENFAAVGSIYIADGHHRAASAVKVAIKRRREHPDYDGTEEFNYFLSVLFPEEELMILPYNRVVKDLNGKTREEFVSAVSERFSVEECGRNAVMPGRKGCFGMYLEGCWYKLTPKPGLVKGSDPVSTLDVAVLYDFLLAPVLGIGDPRLDPRIGFIGGIRGLPELERRVGQDMAVAFSLYPTSISELFAVSDAGMLMPPKSTWFEPKLRSGLFIHRLSE
ncbi:MAG: DUF1015 family protein [Lachnospiraceae bacterium]|nr:DUF1015 family protein [Lachnospiraceae bacterium]